ncbi:hypothetical protein BGZ90_007310, partial [Linnemannia elongata]
MSDVLASTAKNGTTRAQLLDRFFENWVGVNKSRIQRRTKLKPKVFTVFQDLCDSEGGFKGRVTDFLTNLTAAMFEHQGYSPVVKYEHVKEELTWKGEFFGRTIKSTLLRDASPLNRAGDQYRFIHDIFFDYFRSLAFYTPDQGEDDGSDDGEDNDSDDSQGDDSNSSEGDETDDGDEEDSDSSEMDDSGEGAGDNEGDGGGILGPSDFFFIGLTGESGGALSGKYCSSGGNGGSFGGKGDTSGGNSGSTHSGDGSSHGDGNWSGGNGDATNGERGSNGLFSGSSGGSGGSGGDDNNSNGGKDGSKEDRNSPRKGKEGSRSKKKGRSTKSRSSTSSDSFSRQNVFKDPHVLELLVDRVHSDPRFEKRLFVNIEQSKLSAVPSLAAANSITILYMAGKSFRDVDLDGVKIPYDYLLDGGHGTPNALLSGAEGKPQFFGWDSRADRLGPLIPRPTGAVPDNAPGEKPWGRHMRPLHLCKDPILQLSGKRIYDPRNDNFTRELFVEAFDMLWDDGWKVHRNGTVSETANEFTATGPLALVHQFLRAALYKLTPERNARVRCYDFTLEMLDNPALAALVEYKWYVRAEITLTYTNISINLYLASGNINKAEKWNEKSKKQGSKLARLKEKAIAQMALESNANISDVIDWEKELNLPFENMTIRERVFRKLSYEHPDKSEVFEALNDLESIRNKSESVSPTKITNGYKYDLEVLAKRKDKSEFSNR